MNLSFRLTPRAYDDLKNIARYTRQQWGEGQREKYMRALDDRFRWLSEHPRSGKHRPDVAEGYYCFPQGSHPDLLSHRRRCYRHHRCATQAHGHTKLFR